MAAQIDRNQQVDRNELEMKVQAMYRNVAEHPRGDFHFEMGRVMAERLGYRLADLDRIPAESIDSFAGAGYYFHFIDDMTDAQRAKAEALRRRDGIRNFTYVKGYIDAAPFEDGSFDVVISNGALNLAVDKPQVFREIACLLRQVNDQYRFLSGNAQVATKKFGVKSVSLRADKP